jgi:DNA modification methylase
MSAERISGVNWQKPERLVQRIVESSTKRGYTVFDPFAGSGTTSAVCMKTGRYSVGCEIDKDIYDRAIKRLERIEDEIASDEA